MCILSYSAAANRAERSVQALCNHCHISDLSSSAKSNLKEKPFIVGAACRSYNEKSAFRFVLDFQIPNGYEGRGPGGHVPGAFYYGYGPYGEQYGGGGGVGGQFGGVGGQFGGAGGQFGGAGGQSGGQFGGVRGAGSQFGGQFGGVGGQFGGAGGQFGGAGGQFGGVGGAGSQFGGQFGGVGGQFGGVGGEFGGVGGAGSQFGGQFGGVGGQFGGAEGQFGGAGGQFGGAGSQVGGAGAGAYAGNGARWGTKYYYGAHTAAPQNQNVAHTAAPQNQNVAHENIAPQNQNQNFAHENIAPQNQNVAHTAAPQNQDVAHTAAPQNRDVAHTAAPQNQNFAHKNIAPQNQDVAHTAAPQNQDVAHTAAPHNQNFAHTAAPQNQNFAHENTAPQNHYQDDPHPHGEDAALNVPVVLALNYDVDAAPLVVRDDDVVDGGHGLDGVHNDDELHTYDFEMKQAIQQCVVGGSSAEQSSRMFNVPQEQLERCIQHHIINHPEDVAEDDDTNDTASRINMYRVRNETSHELVTRQINDIDFSLKKINKNDLIAAVVHIINTGSTYCDAAKIYHIKPRTFSTYCSKIPALIEIQQKRKEHIQQLRNSKRKNKPMPQQPTATTATATVAATPQQPHNPVPPQQTE
ncbi:uncharacterized protein [Musca autumnalis]|uniref:uncharacterized protein n=1 Tax=Musca autumnalis TaxID=221902 RepID=UPI003CF90EC7